MKQSTIQVRIDTDLKSQADELFARMGTTLSEAVRLFIAQSVNDKRLPFTPTLRQKEKMDGAFGALAHYVNVELRKAEKMTLNSEVRGYGSR